VLLILLAALREFSPCLLLFVGPHGRFTAHRDTERGQRTRSWRAYRTIHQHSYKHYLGTTDHLTLAALEQAVAKLQAYGDAL